MKQFVLATLVLVLSGCSSVSTVRLQPEAIEAGPNLRPVAAIQANAISFYLLFIPIPGVDLDRAINQMLVVTAKSMGADKVANLQFEITPDGGVWALRKLLGYRSARASGIAVQVAAPAPDPGASAGPEAPVGPTEPGDSTTEPATAP
ncbi:MAG: hypothetical protein KJO07_09950 [Deltaproteobacteria bacterium]|nr:hypothetical protein [Deltaproteobacteria bacterium]